MTLIDQEGGDQVGVGQQTQSQDISPMRPIVLQMLGGRIV
jgi:hypothetical protein